MLGPIAVATLTGKRFQSRGPHAYAVSLGDGVVTNSPRDQPYHDNGTSTPPHCRLKRCVPPPDVQRPKLKVEIPAPIARSIIPQYRSMFADNALYSPSADAQVISSSPPERKAQPPAIAWPR